MTKDKTLVKETPLPTWQIVSVCMVQLAEACNVTVLFPFMAFMVEDMGYTGSRLGYYVGGLAGAFCAAQFCSSVLWGMISDRYGRKIAIITGTLGAAAGMLIFGTAKVYVQAVMGRLIGGFLCGNLGVMKSFLAEITDDTNRGKGFSYISSFWAVGCLIAPLVGGLLSNPADKYPAFFSQSGLFGYFPYLLPCLLCACLNLCSVILCSITMTETRKPKAAPAPSSEVEMTSSAVKNPMTDVENQRGVFIIQDDEDEEGSSEDTTDDEESEVNDGSAKLSNSPVSEKKLRRQRRREAEGSSLNLERSISDMTDVDSDDMSTSSKKRRLGGGEDDVIIDDSDEICCPDLTCYNIFAFCSRGNKAASSDYSYDVVDTSSKHGNSLATNTSTSASPATPSSYSVLRRRGVILATSSYGVLCMGYILFDETIPLFLKLDRAQGGFSFDSGRIGTLISISAGFMLLFTTFVLPHFASKSKQWLYEIGIIGAIPLTLCWPALAVLNSTVLLHIKDENTYLLILWPLLLVLNILKNVFSCFSFTAVMIQVNHSAEEEYLGAVNGLGQSLAALARAIGPAIGGMLWSISTELHFIFLNFISVIFIFFLCGYVNRLLPPSIDFKKKKPNDAGNSHEEENLDAMEMMH
eukprot:gene13269-14574_t